MSRVDRMVVQFWDIMGYIHIYGILVNIIKMLQSLKAYQLVVVGKNIEYVKSVCMSVKKAHKQLIRFLLF